LCSGESLSEALESNDECGEEGTCALNALQHRRGKDDPMNASDILPPGSPKWL
ncbi:UREG, partial [Symbiodinium pilosum]